MSTDNKYSDLVSDGGVDPRPVDVPASILQRRLAEAEESARCAWTTCRASDNARMEEMRKRDEAQAIVKRVREALLHTLTTAETIEGFRAGIQLTLVMMETS